MRAALTLSSAGRALAVLVLPYGHSSEVKSGSTNHYMIVRNWAPAPFSCPQQPLTIVDDDVYPTESLTTPISCFDKPDASVMQRHFPPTARILA